MTKTEQAELIAEVSALIEARLQDGKTVSAKWVTHEVVAQHRDIRGSDAHWYTLCAYDAVRNAVRKALRRYDPISPEDGESNRQLLLPGYSRLQLAYPVRRDGEEFCVPIAEMTHRECRQKCAELTRMAQGCLEHVREFEKYMDERFGVDAAAE